MLIATLLVIAGAIYSVLGALHAVFTFMDERDPRRLAPDDPAVTAAMQTSKLRLSRGAVTMWQAWISFNLTHSLAAIMFGVGCIVVAAWFGVAVFPPWVLFLLTGISLVFALIGLRYWFGVPRAGAVAATLCLGAASGLYIL
jgi:hypothetical protein